MAYNKTVAIFIHARREITAVLCFLRKGVKLHFYSLGTIFEENIRGVQRGAAPWLWVSNRGEKHPCWHTILLAKSSELYFEPKDRKKNDKKMTFFSAKIVFFLSLGEKYLHSSD